MRSTALQTADIGHLVTRAGGVIRNCRLSYRCVGEANAERSNILLWPTCFTETTEALLATIEMLMDLSRYQVILIDALGNGVSSSPSNTAGFPQISIHDMVRSQHTLLTQHLGIAHVHAVCGISMGGMQALQWMVSYPDFMHNVVSMAGTPQQSAYDLLLWNTQLHLIRDALSRGDTASLEFTRKRLIDLDQLHLHTPAFLVRTQSPMSLSAYLDTLYQDRLDLRDLAAQIEAMLSQDIFQGYGLQASALKNRLKARLLLIATTQDLMVNPSSALALSAQLGCALMSVDNDNGHDFLPAAAAQVRERLGTFLLQ